MLSNTKLFFDEKTTPHMFRAFFCTSCNHMNISTEKIEVLLRHKTKKSGKAVENYTVSDIPSRLKFQRKFFKYLILQQRIEDNDYHE